MMWEWVFLVIAIAGLIWCIRERIKNGSGPDY